LKQRLRSSYFYQVLFKLFKSIKAAQVSLYWAVFKNTIFPDGVEAIYKCPLERMTEIVDPN